MKKFIKENWFKITILTLVVIGISIYYFGYFLPQQRQSTLLNQQEKCREVGQEAYKADGQEYGGVENLDDPQYGYSQKLNTCIYASGYHYYGDPSAGVGGDIFKYNCNAHWEQWVKDSYSNEKILDVSNYLDNKCQWMTQTDVINKFDTDSEALFNSQ
jgi:hypothetical protein